MSSLEKRKEGMGPGEYEQKAVEAGFVRVCGCDEAGAVILYEYVCSLIRLVHRYLSGSSIRMLLQIDTIEFKKCRCIQQFNIRMPLFQLITNPFIPGR